MLAAAVRDGHGDLRLEHVFFRRERLRGDRRDRVRRSLSLRRRLRRRVVPRDGPRAARTRRPRRALRRDVRARGERLRPRSRPRLLRELSRLRTREDRRRRRRRARRRREAVAETARAEARRYLLLAEAARRRSVLEPVLVAVAGGIASGKSTLAERLGEELSAPVVERGSNAQVHDSASPRPRMPPRAHGRARTTARSARASTPRCCAALGWCSRPADR